MNTMVAVLLGACLAASPEPPPVGTVQLPLPEYQDLVDRAARPQPPAVESTARVVAERLTLQVDGDTARFDGIFELDFSGPHPPALTVRLHAAPDAIGITPTDGAAVGRGDDHELQIRAARAGRVTLRVQGPAAFQDNASGGSAVPLAKPQAPIAELNLDLPADLGWSLDGATVAEELVAGERRKLRLARASGSSGSLRLASRVAVREEATAYVRGVAVTLVEPGPETLLRTDAVLFDVQRGSLAELAVRLSAGYEPEPVATTDEESTPFQLDGGRLVVPRKNRLSGRGHLLLTSTLAWPAAGAVLALPALEPEVEVRSRFLVAAASLAADLAPQPAGSWLRVDREDLPPTLRDAIEGLALAAVWRLNPGAPATDLGLAIRALPPVDLAPGLLPERRTVTVATVDGALVHRDVFTVASGPPALELLLAAGSEFWSAKVDGEPTRPVEENGVHRFPLPPGRGRLLVVEVVTAEKRALPTGKSKENLRFELPAVRGSVLRHEWRLMLPENRDYRLVAGELRAVVAVPPPPAAPVAVGESSGIYDLQVITRRDTGSSVTQVELEQIPEARDPWVVLQNTPGVLVDRVNVGGNESGQQSTFLGPLPVQAKVPETGKAVLLSGALPPAVVSVTIESRPIKKKGRRW